MPAGMSWPISASTPGALELDERALRLRERLGCLLRRHNQRVARLVTRTRDQTVDGHQYVAVTTGLGGGSPRNVPSTITPDIEHPSSGHALYVFRLRERK